LRIAETIEKAIPHFHELLSLPDDITYRVCGLKGNKYGCYWGMEKVVEIDQKVHGAFEAVEILAHELVHAEQWHTGKLDMVISHGRWKNVWEGRQWSNGTTYAAYRARPWEVEAFDRQLALATQVWGDMYNDFPYGRPE
jgi:hypothetical protein